MIVVAAKGTTCSETRGAFETGFDGSWLVCRVPDQAGIAVRAARARCFGRPVSGVVDGARLSDLFIYHTTGRYDVERFGIRNTTRWSEAKPR